MKTFALILFTFLSFNFCFAQKSDKDIEAIKKGLIGNWRDSDTTSYWKVGYHISSKKITFYVYCPDKSVVKRTMSYTIEKRYEEEQHREVIVLILPAKRRKIASHECDICKERTLDHIALWDWTDIVISKDQMTFRLYSGKECYRLTKE
jgi:hypothetical protein